MGKHSLLRAVLARLALAGSTEDQQRVLDQQKVIDAIQQRLDIAPEQNQNSIKEELLKAKNKMADIKDSQATKAPDAN